MFDRQFTSVEDIDKTFKEHLESLRVSGLPFDEKSLMVAWADAIANFEEGLTQPPWKGSL